MLKKLRFLILCTLLAVPLLSFAESSLAGERVITGTVTGAIDGEPLPGVSVLIQGTNLGTSTNADGEYEISVTDEHEVLVFSFMGYESQSIEIEDQEVIDIELESDILGLEDDIVVTGFSVGTPQTKAPFSIQSIRAEQLEQVPATNPGNAIRARAPGVRVVQGSGMPGSAMNLRLRGSNNLGTDGQGPLLVVDGMVTRGRIQDFDMQNVESIEIIKGAAAASLYGSLAGSGVVQIITKRGADMDDTMITVRNELGFSSLGNRIDLAEHHAYSLDDDGNYRNEQGELNAVSARGIMDRPYDQNIDQLDEFFTGNNFFTNFASIEGRQGNTNYMLSFENMNDGGIIDELPDYKRRNLRANIDSRFTDRITLSLSTFYSNIEGYAVTETGQGMNPFWGILMTHPDTDLRQPGPGGEEYNPFVSIHNSQNPLYVASTRDFQRDRERFMGTANAQVKLTDWWQLDGRYSLDRTNTQSTNFIEKGTQRATDPDNPLSGSYWRSNSIGYASIANFRSLVEQEFGRFNTGLTLSYSYEYRPNESTSASSGDFIVAGVRDLSQAPQERLSTSSSTSKIIAEDIMANLTLDYDETYIFDGILRRDGTSLFGADERQKFYYRLAGAYRLTEDFPIPNTQELKLRASYGTSGRRPGFSAQYEVINVTAEGFTKQTAGNRNLKPADVRELELGFDLTFMDRFMAEFNYAETVASDQILLVPISPTTGYNNQWQNAGTLESEIVEFALNGRLVDRMHMSWDVNLSFDKLFRQEITELNRPAFFRQQGSGEAGVDIFRIAEGENLGSMHGQQFVRSTDDLILDDNGHVMNYRGYDPNDPDNNLGVDDFTTNSEGYLIPEGTEFTADERPMHVVDEDREIIRQQIGDAIPDFNVGLSSTFHYRNFTFFTLLDWQQGGDVYNYTRQMLYRHYRHGDMDMSGEPEGEQKHAEYFASGLYNDNAPVSEFVEDASFLKLREVSLRYSLHQNLIQRARLGEILREASISISGRNLYTLTGYSGFDPEVAAGGNATNFRVDEYTYPNFRTITMSLELRF